MGVGAVVIHDGELLVVLRGSGAAQGLWSIPGGHVERGERLIEAVEREVLEETGVAVRCGEFLGWVERIDHDYHYVILDFTASPVDATDRAAIAADDAAEVRWVDAAELRSLPLVPGLELFLEQAGALAELRS